MVRAMCPKLIVSTESIPARYALEQLLGPLDLTWAFSNHWDDGWGSPSAAIIYGIDKVFPERMPYLLIRDCGFIDNEFLTGEPPSQVMSFRGLSVLCASGRREEKLEAGLVVSVDIVATTFLKLSFHLEATVAEKDQHGRTRPYDNTGLGSTDVPIVDCCRSWLVEWLGRVGVRASQRDLWDGQPFAAFISHDIDVQRMYRRRIPPIVDMARGLMSRDLKGTLLMAVSWMQSQCLRRDPFDSLVCFSPYARKHGGRETYFMLLGPDTMSGPIDVPLLMYDSRKVRANGHEVAWHASYAGMEDSAVMKSEHERFRSAVGIRFPGVRFHYLRCRMPDTLAELEGKVHYDASCGFAEREGFRAGTCFAFQPYSPSLGRKLNVVEIPLLVMDVTLISDTYRGLTTEEALNRIADVIKTVARFGGVFSLLWHNINMLSKDHRLLYNRIIELLLEQDAAFLSGDEIARRWLTGRIGMSN